MAAADHIVHTLADLASWTATGPSLAVIGHPVAHSLSPAIHNAALAAMAVADPQFGSWRYHMFDLAAEELAAALPRFHAAGFAGLNVTVPHKEAVLRLVAEAEPLVRATGAANTLRRTASGWRADNTDCGGLVDALRAEFGLGLAGKPVILLGAGGAARAAAVQCLREGAAGVWIGNRGAGRLDTLIAALTPLAGGIPVRGFALDQPPAGLPAGALVINATSLGLRPNDSAPVDLARLPRPGWVYEMIYNPPATALLRQAAALGLPAANGRSMLVHQGARALALWTGRTVPVDVMDRAAQTALAALHP